MHIHTHSQSGSSLTPWLLGLAALIAGGLLSQYLFYKTPVAPVLSASTTKLEPPRVLQDFALVDHHQQPFTLAQLQGKWTFIFFGYTHCPDICPTTLTTLNILAKNIAALSAAAKTPKTPPQYTFVSVDPERDTAELLAKFVPYFNPDFIGITGTVAAVEAMTKQLSVLYLKVDPQNTAGYLMDHSAALLLIDPHGRLHALMSPPFDTALMAQDFQKLSAYYEATQ